MADILDRPVMAEMSYRKKKAEAVATGLERPINDHLLKLLAAEGRDDRAHWKRELVNWLTEIAEIRLKPDHKPMPAALLFEILFDEPFGGVEARNAESRLRRLARDGYRLREVAPGAAAAALRDFHHRFARDCATGALTDEGVARLLDDAFPA